MSGYFIVAGNGEFQSRRKFDGRHDDRAKGVPGGLNCMTGWDCNVLGSRRPPGPSDNWYVVLDSDRHVLGE